MVRILSILIASTFASTPALAKSAFSGMVDSSAKTLYGSSASFTSSCAACHGNSVPSLATKFGTDFSAKYISLGYPLSLTQSQMDNVIKGLELVDSDGDGANTKAELIAGTNPGDAASKPAPAPTCTAAAPSLSLDASSKTGAPGDKLSFTALLKNNDSAGCASSTFSLAVTPPANFTGSAASQSVVLAPGASSSVIVSIQSPAGQADGNYNFSVASSDSLQALHAKSVSGTYIVKALAVCQPNAPAVVLSPTSQSAPAGSSLTYKMTVTNNDSSICASSSFQVSASATSPLSVVASANSLSIAPGQSGSVNLTLKSDANAVAGTYSFKGSVSDAAVAIHSGSVSGQYLVSASNSADVTPPTAPSNLRARSRRDRAALRWDASSDNVSVEKYLIYVDGAKIAESAELYARIRISSGPHEITIKAVDAAGNISNASNSVRIETSRVRIESRSRHD